MRVQAKEHLQPQEAGRKVWDSPFSSTFIYSTALPTPRFRTFGLLNGKVMHPVFLSHPGCDSLLQQPKETHTLPHS